MEILGVVSAVAAVLLLLHLYRYFGKREYTEADRLEERKQMRDDRR